LPSDISDILKVLIYTELDLLILPQPQPIIPPGIRPILLNSLNYYDQDLDLPSDIQEVYQAVLLRELSGIAERVFPAPP
jgi:hypothetical protein